MKSCEWLRSWKCCPRPQARSRAFKIHLSPLRMFNIVYYRQQPWLSLLSSSNYRFLRCESNSSGALYCIVSFFQEYLETAKIFSSSGEESEACKVCGGRGKNLDGCPRTDEKLRWHSQMTPPNSMFVLDRLKFNLTRKTNFWSGITETYRVAVRVSCVGDRLFSSDYMFWFIKTPYLCVLV